METLIELGVYRCLSNGANGTLRAIISTTYSGDVPCFSYHYKIIKDGDLTEYLVHIDGNQIVDSQGNRWERCL